MQIPLKAKYRRAIKTRYGANGDHGRRYKRNKIGYASHVAIFGEAPRRTLRVNGRTGAGVMEVVS